MRNLSLFGLLPLVLMAGCAHNNPNILSEEPYNQVRYTSHPGPVLKKVETLSVETKGYQANIRQTVPLLYKKALDYKGRMPASAKPNRDDVFLSNIRTRVWTTKEPFQQSYQDCQTVYKTERVPHQNCHYVSAGGYGNSGSYGKNVCNTEYRMESRSDRVCTTKYRTVITTVLHQEATGDLYVQH